MGTPIPGLCAVGGRRGVHAKPVGDTTYSEYGATAMTLAQNEYDNYSPGCASGAGSCVITATPAGSVRQRDAAYTTSTTLRGNVTSTYRYGDGTSWLFYNDTGIVVKSKDPRGTIGTAAPDSSKNYAVPSSVTVAGLSSSMSWNDALGLTSASGPNGDTSSTAYGTSTFIGRPSGKTLPTGLTVSYAYTQNTTTETVNATPTARWTRTTTDGFGRPVKVETGTGATTNVAVSVVETQYEPCACTPIGKMKKTSRPFAGNGTASAWTTYNYDALGRTVSVVAPDGSTTSYTYEGASVKVTDAKSKWKKYVKDAVGNLVTVWEPNPGVGADLESTYLYNELDQLTSVAKLRGTTNQLRTFTYGSFGMTAKTEPETGTTTFVYRPDGRLNHKVDAKGQKTESIYEDDIIPGYAQKRVKEIRKYVSNVQDTCQTVEMYYDGAVPPGGDAVSTAGTSGRLSGVRYFGRSIGSGQCAQTYVEQYTYLNYGAMTSKRLKVIRGTASGVLETVAEYDGEGRLKSVTYPGTNRKVQYAFNDRGLPSGLTDVNAGTSIVSNVTYGVAGELLTIGGESRTYNINGQLTQLNLPGRVIQYNYTAGQNNGKIDSMVDSSETVTYQYDSLQRLIMASGSTGWTQGYGYDLYGNLTSKTGLNAGNIGVDAGTNRMAGGSYDANGNQTVVPLIAGSEMPDSLTSMSYDVSNRLTHAENNGATRKADYDYDAGNKRIWEKRWVNSTVVGEWMYFFGITGQRMGRYAVSVSGATMTLTQEQASVWFGGKLVEKVDGFGAKTYPSEDRLGSVGKYLPYGESKPGASNPAADHEKFATYTRDAGTGLDYADQRWHVPGAGRFLTADPYQASGGPGDPGSWNRFGYVDGDVVNLNDPSGLLASNSPSKGGEMPSWYFGASGSIVPSLGSASTSPTGQLFDTISPIEDMLDSWIRTPAGGYELTMAPDLAAAAFGFQSSVPSGGVVVRGVQIIVSVVSGRVRIVVGGLAALAAIAQLIDNSGKSWQVSCNGRLKRKDGTWEDVNLGWIQADTRDEALRKANEMLKEMVKNNPDKWDGHQVKHCSDPIWRPKVEWPSDYPRTP